LPSSELVIFRWLKESIFTWLKGAGFVASAASASSASNPIPSALVRWLAMLSCDASEGGEEDSSEDHQPVGTAARFLSAREVGWQQRSGMAMTQTGPHHYGNTLPIKRPS
jgi:hypothetical protein